MGAIFLLLLPLDNQLVRRLVGGYLSLFLHAEDLLQRGHRDLHHVVGGLAGGQLLQLQARPDQGFHHRVALVPRAPHDELEGDARDERDYHHAGRDRLDPPVYREQTEHQDAQHQHVQDKTRPAPHVARIQLAGVLRDELLAALVDLYGLVFGPVIGEEAFYVFAHRRYPDEVEQEDADPQHAFDQVKEDGVLDRVAEQRPQALRPEHGCDEEQQERQPEAEDQGDGDLLFREVLVLAERDVGRERERLHAQPQGLGEREEAPDHGQPEDLAFFRHRPERLRLYLHVARRRPHRHPPEVGGAHEDAFHDRLPADPHPVSPYLLARCWRFLNRCTRPPVSTMRCLPV